MQGRKKLHKLSSKMTPKRAWPGSRDQISKFGDPLITRKTSTVNYRYINNNKTTNIKDKKLKSLQRRVRSTVQLYHN